MTSDNHCLFWDCLNNQGNLSDFTLFCLILGGYQIADFGGKNPNVHLVIIKE